MTDTPDDIIAVNRLCLPMSIGLAPFEREWRQTVCVSVRMFVDPAVRRSGGHVSYVPVIEHLQERSASGAHVELIETLAEEVARKALEHPAVRRVEVTVEKPDIFPQAASVGITISVAAGDL